VGVDHENDSHFIYDTQVGAKEEIGSAGQLIRAAGLRATPKRVAVLAELSREPDDVTAQTLHGRLRKRGERLGLATVYRTLQAFAEAGLIDTLPHNPGEVCYRRCGEEHHHHLVCSQCHRVVEVADCSLEGWLARVSADHGFITTGHRLEIDGLCAACR
jgi:Fur family transcriptional regulator, ferric uptake regulator